MAEKARHHHFVPQYYLRLFSDGQSRDSKIFVTDLERKRRYKTCPRNIGGSRDFNRVGAAVDALEKVFADFDNKAAPILKQIVRTRSLPEKADHGNILLNFVALLLVRVPAIRDHFQAFHEQAAREAGRLLVSNPDVYRSVMDGVRARYPPEVPLSPHEAEKRYEEDKRFFEGGDYWISFSHGYFLKYEMDMMDTALYALSRMRWHLLHSDTEFFVCSDRPVSLVSSEPGSRFVGLATPDAEIVVPIANNAALWGAYRGGIASSVSAPDEIVRRVNGITLANGGLCIYSPKRSFRYDDGEGTKTSDSLF